MFTIKWLPYISCFHFSEPAPTTYLPLQRWHNELQNNQPAGPNREEPPIENQQRRGGKRASQ